MTAFGQHSMVPLFYARRASVALRAHTACTACEAPSKDERVLHRNNRQQNKKLTVPVMR